MKIVKTTHEAVTIEFNSAELMQLQEVFRAAEGCCDDHYTLASSMALVCELGASVSDANFTEKMYRELQVKTDNAPWLKEAGNQTGD